MKEDLRTGPRVQGFFIVQKNDSHGDKIHQHLSKVWVIPFEGILIKIAVRVKNILFQCSDRWGRCSNGGVVSSESQSLVIDVPPVLSVNVEPR